jgi:hypothetical protein
LNDTYTKFPNDQQIRALSNTIMNELVKLPGQEKSINDIISHNMDEITEIVNAGKYEEQKNLILTDLERINAFTSNPKQVTLMIESGFVKTLNQLADLTLKDQDNSNLNENLINNEMSLLKKVTEEIKDITSPTLGEILANIIKVIQEKSQFRDLFLNSLKSLAGFISNNEVFEKHLRNKLDTKFIDQLFDIQENYIDDLEVGKEINNILCNLCLKSDLLAAQIIKRGGLANVMEELKSCLKLNDEISNNLKFNGLKFIHSLCKDKNYLQKFLAANGADLIQNIMKYELKNLEPNKKKVSQYVTYDPYNLNSSLNSVDNNNPKIVECFKIINKIIKSGNSNLEPNLISNMIELVDRNYPNKYLFAKGMKILSNLKEKLSEIELKATKDLVQIILSYNSFFLGDEKIKNTSVPNLANILYNDEKLGDILKFFGSNNEANDAELAEIFTDFDNVTNFLCYLGLYTEFDINKFKNSVDFKDYSAFIDALVNKLAPGVKNEGGVLAVMKILQNFLVIDPESKNHLLVKNNKFDEVLLKSGMNFYKPANYPFIQKFLKEFQNIFDQIGDKTTEGRLTESYLNYLENIYLRSFEVFDHYNTLLNSNEPVSPNFEETVASIKDLVTLYLKQEGNDNFIKSSIKKLSNQVICNLT